MKIPGLADRLNQRRVTLGWKSLTEFALDTHRTPQVVHAWCVRGQTPKWESLERLAQELKCPLIWLLLGDRAFEEIPMLRAFYEDLHGKPWEEGTSDKRDCLLAGLDDAKARPRFRFWHYLDLHGTQATETIER